MNHGSLFSGIGGFDLAAEWMGWKNLFHVEKDDFCRQVIQHQFPNSQSYEDIKQFTGYPWSGRIDILTGGFPCQPFSTAGKRAGVSDDRHLWPEMLRVIREVRPAWVVAENVRGLLSWSDGMVFDQVCLDLEGEGYQVFPTVLPAASVSNCPHKRDRVWIIAYSDRYRNDRASGKDVGSESKSRLQEWHEVVLAMESARLRQVPSDPNGEVLEYRDGKGEAARSAYAQVRTQSPRRSGGWQAFPSESPLCGGDDGLPSELDGITFSKWRKESVKAYGNAIVPQVAYQIFKSIQQHG